MIHTMEDTHASTTFLLLNQFAQRNQLKMHFMHHHVSTRTHVAVLMIICGVMIYKIGNKILKFIFLTNIDFTSKLSHRQVWERFEGMDVVIFNDAGKMWHMQYIIYSCSSFTDELSYMIRIFSFLFQNPF